MKDVLMYESAPDVLATAPVHFPAHNARNEEFRDRGLLLVTGPFADPQDGAMAIFTTREAAEEFVAGDPLVLNGVVVGWTIKEWRGA